MGIAERESRRVKLTGKSVAAEMIKSQPVKVSSSKGRPKADYETKKRISMTVLPSLYENVQKIAYMERKSIAGIVEEFFERYVEENRDKIKEYDKMQG